MNINSINTLSFKSRTGEGNPYEKSAEGKKFIPALMVGNIASVAIVAKASGLEDDAIKLFEKSAKQPFNKNLFSALKTASVLSAALLALPAGLLIGQIFDMFINHTRRKDADRFTNTGIIPGNSNSGKITFGVIGACFAAAIANIIHNGGKVGMEQLANEIKEAGENNTTVKNEALSELKDIEKIATKGIKVVKYFNPAMIFVAFLLSGAIYDHGVNKSRDELYQEKRQIFANHLVF